MAICLKGGGDERKAESVEWRMCFVLGKVVID
jgi:hypothetical protein